MPKAEMGSTKQLNNQMKSKGLQRLRWYCQLCERQMRDENGFKMHTQSESHTRKAIMIGESGVNKAIQEYSRDFLRDFLTLLRTAHGEKKVHMNRFYQEYIAHKEHIHMNATKWPSLTELAKHLGREGICRVEEEERGLFISWVDNSPEALRRQEAVRKRERQDRGDEERELKALERQIKAAKAEARETPDEDAEADEERRALKREEGKEPIKLSFGGKRKAEEPLETVVAKQESSQDEAVAEDSDTKTEANILVDIPAAAAAAAPVPLTKVSLKMGSVKPTNVFAAAKKKNALAGAKSKASPFGEPKKMSEQERIMKEEIESKNRRGPASFGGPAGRPSFNGPPQKKQRL